MNIPNEQLKSVAALCAAINRLHEDLEDAEKDVGVLKAALKEAEEHSLPDLMAELGIESLELTDGSKVTIKPFIGASITKEHEFEAHEWLRGNGFGDLIKERTVCNVHPSTLKAWAKEQVEQGNEIPDDLFSIYVGRKAYLK